MEETITIERMGYGSEAVGRLESGKAVFVEGGAPGDVAALEIVEDKPTFARARIARLVKPSELRVRPRCEAGAACGGCPWQHLSYDAQLEAKRANVAAALERTAKFGRERAEELQAALDKAKADNEAYKADAEKREADMRRDFAIDTKLAQMGVRNAKAARAIIPNIADAKLDEQGNLTGIDFEALKKDNAYMFSDQPRESAGGDPKGGAGSDGLADFRAAFGLTDESSKE